MHYRRMDPQPPNHASLLAVTVYSGADGRHVRRWAFSFYERHIETVLFRRSPDDMHNAEPVQLSDGEWFWRRAL